MPGQHEYLPSDFPTTTATPPDTSTDAPPAGEDSPFVPDFDDIRNFCFLCFCFLNLYNYLIFEI